MSTLLYPDSVREKIARRYSRTHRQWLAGTDTWPLIIKLGSPTESHANQHKENLLQWISEWKLWRGSGVLTWREKHWRVIGTQRLPEKLTLNNPREVAAWLGDAQRWERATLRYQHFIAKWPALTPIMHRYFDILADYMDADIDRFARMLEWISLHPQSNLYPRQLPISGVNSKWLEQRKALFTDLLSALREGQDKPNDFYGLCGLKPMPQLLRLRILDAALRSLVGGLEDISAPLENLAELNLPISHVFIIENLQTGLAFGDLPGSIVIVGLGYHVDVLSKLPWLARAKGYYWGDIDTHGFAILNRARSHLPDLQSILMDENTLQQHKSLWGSEDKQHPTACLTQLTLEEKQLYSQLKQQSWGINIRLEQEKIDWMWSWRTISALVECDDTLNQL